MRGLCMERTWINIIYVWIMRGLSHPPAQADALASRHAYRWLVAFEDLCGFTTWGLLGPFSSSSSKYTACLEKRPNYLRTPTELQNSHFFLGDGSGSCMDYTLIRHWLYVDYGWITHGLCMDRVWIMHGLCVDYVWIVHEFCVDYAWIMHALCLDYAWIVHGLI